MYYLSLTYLFAIDNKQNDMYNNVHNVMYKTGGFSDEQKPLVPLSVSFVLFIPCADPAGFRLFAVRPAAALGQ
jgi:hypothetical protein